MIDTACEIFIINGFHATTTRQITDRMNLVAGALYNHFKSKAALFEAVLNTYHPWLRIPDALKRAEGDNAEAYIRDATKELLNEWNKQPELIRLHLIEVLEFNSQHIPALFERVFSQIPEIIKVKQEGSSQLRTAKVSFLYRAIVGLFFGYLVSENALKGRQNSAMGNYLDDSGTDYFSDIYLSGLFNQYAKEEDNEPDKVAPKESEPQ